MRDTLVSRILYPQCRLIRSPIQLKGKKSITLGIGLTTGVGNRIEAWGPLGEIHFGKDVQINDYCHITAVKSVSIDDNTLIASKVFITDHNHGSYSGDNQDSPNSVPVERRLISSPVSIGKNVWIGENVCILPGVRIGDGSIIACNSVVTKDIPKETIAAGSPAKPIKIYNQSTKKWSRL